MSSASMPPPAPRAAILNGQFDALTFRQTVDHVFDRLDTGTRGWLCTVNVSTLMTMRKNRRLQSFVDRAALVVADGQPIVWCAPLFGTRLPERVAGVDLIDALCARAAAEDRSVYLLGGAAQVVSDAMGALSQRHPTLRIAGADGYFDASSAQTRAEAIRASAASLLFVGMGSPRQEIFIDAHWDRLGVGMAIGVGGSFDVLCGQRARAHPWLRDAGLEWVVRLVQEPRRLLWRYLATNTTFCVLIARALWSRARRSLVERLQ